jgi:hypothetical protein
VKRGVKAVKREAALLAILLLLFLLSAMTVPSLSETEWTVGVQVGDWFKYEGTLVEYWSDEGVPFPPNQFTPYLVTFNESDWFRRTVTNVSGTTITWEIVTHWKNGTETTDTLVDDIANSMGGHYAIGANMEVDDQVRAPYLGFDACIIDETVDWEYENMTRETNHAWKNGTSGGARLQWYWDKATGVQVKFIDNSSAITAQGNAYWLAMSELVDSSVWIIPESHTWTIMLLVLTASTAATVLYRRRKLYR